MSDTGPLRRRRGALRWAVVGVPSLGVLAAVTWATYRHLQVTVSEPAPVVVRAAALPPGGPPAGVASREQGNTTDDAPSAIPLSNRGGPPGAPADAAADAGAPAAPDHARAPASGTHEAASASAEIPRPSFDIVRVAPSGSAVIAGRAAPNAEVALLDNGREIARTKSDESGQFVVIPDQPLPSGGQELALQAEQPGRTPVKGDTPALLVVPERPPGRAPPSAGLHRARADGAGGTVAVLAPPDAAPRLLTVPPGSDGTLGQVALRVVDYDARGAIRFAGTARPGSSVRLYIDDVPVGEAAADAQGRWSLAPAGPVDAGQHRLRADDLGPRGQVLSRAELPFQRAAFGLASPGGGQVVVQPRQSLWRIARQVYGQGVRYTIIYDANRDQIRDPDRIYPGQVFTLPSAPATAAQSDLPAGGSD